MQIIWCTEGKHIIVYAGINYSMMETKYLRMLDEAVVRGIFPNAHILFRPHPWRGPHFKGRGRFFSINWRHITMDPHMVNYYKREIASPSRNLFMVDYQITNMLLTLADVVISPRSTLLIEAMVKCKPVLVFFPEEQEYEVYSKKSVYFNDFLEMDIVNTFLQNDQFFDRCADLERQIGDTDIAARLGENAQHFAVTDGPTYGERLAALVDETVGEFPA